MNMLLAAVFVAFATSCSDELVTNTGSGEMGDDVTIDFSLEVPQREDALTRTFTQTSEAEFKASDASIVILAFDENHYLTNVYKGTYNSDDSNGVVHYSVTLKSTDQKRIFHVIVNHNDLDISKIEYGMESEVLTSDLMTVDYGKDVYWGRTEMAAGSTVAEFTSNAKTALSGMKLVRNYAKLDLKFSSESTANASTMLSGVEWAIMSIPSKGSVAPYISDQNFANYVDEEAKDGLANYNNLYGTQGYRGNVPRNASNGETFYMLPSVDYIDSVKWVPMSTPIYTFENEGSSDSQWWTKTILLIRAHYKQDNGSFDNEWHYYRISLVDASRNYETLNILRNIVYTVELRTIHDDGAKTAADAYTSPSSSNISGSTVLSSYNSVNLGNAVLRVEYMKKYILYQQSFTMMYRYVPNVNSTSATTGNYITKNEDVTLTTAEAYATDDEKPAFTGDNNTKYSIKSWTQDGSNIENSTYRNFNFESNTPQTGEFATSTTVRVQVKSNPAIYRDVEFILRERYKMQNIELKSDGNNTYTLTVEVPYGLPKEIFPLDFTFEASPACLYPDAARSIMEVNGVDSSIFDVTSKSSFHFHRSVSYSKYGVDLTAAEGDGPTGFVVAADGYKRMSFFFKVNTATVSDGDKIKIGVWSNSFSPDPDGDVKASTAKYIYMWCSYTTSGGLKSLYSEVGNPSYPSSSAYDSKKDPTSSDYTGSTSSSVKRR